MALTGGVKVKWYGDRVVKAVRKGAEAALLKCGAEVEREAKILTKVSGVKISHRWKRATTAAQARRFSKGWKTKHGTPSTPPAPPHQQSSALNRSIQFADTPEGTVIVGPTEKYGKVHEYGGEFGGRHYPARPFMQPALTIARPRFQRHFKGII